MTTLTPILYADGALRLTDHGPRGGGLVLVHVPSNRQASFERGDREAVDKYLTYEIEQRHRTNAANLFDEVRDHYAINPFVPFYHD